MDSLVSSKMSHSPKTVGIITIWQADNYGAELQAYALQEKLNRIGVECENIDFPFYKNPDFHKFRCRRSKYSIGWRNCLKEIIFPFLRGLRGRKNCQLKQKRVQRFQDFYRLTRHSKKRYLSVQELYATPPQYDVYVTGSDQVWNPRIPIAHGPFFLDFAPPEAPRIAYASSFGVEEIPLQAKRFFRQWLTEYSHISVREQSGVELIRKLTGKEAVHVLDPTLLLTADEWAKIASPIESPEPYLLLYDLLPSEPILTFARKLATRNNWKIYRLCRESGQTAESGIRQFPAAGPQDFLGLFRNSSYVVTNSFHGTVFSILFEKDFRVLISERMKNHGRISSLARMLQLESNILLENHKGIDIDFDREAERMTDFKPIRELLEKHRHDSENYLRMALGV